MNSKGKLVNFRILVPYLDEWYSEFDERIQILAQNNEIYLIKPKTKLETSQTFNVNVVQIPFSRRLITLPIHAIISLLYGFILGLKKDVHIIHSFDPHYSGFISSILSKVLNKPFILTLRGDYVLAHRLQLKEKKGYLGPFSKIKIQILHTIVNLTIISASHIVVKGSHQRKKLLERGINISKITVLPTGVDLEMFNPQKSLSRDKEKYLLKWVEVEPKHRIILSYIGRLHPEKGILFLVDVIGNLNKNIRDKILVLFIGRIEPEYLVKIRNKIKKYNIKEQVKIIGYLKHEDIPIALSITDLLLYPTQDNTEGIPVILQEALAIGVPCLVSNVEGIDEIIENGKDGFLLSPTDVSSWVKKVEMLVENEKLRQMLAKNNWEKINKKFNRKKNYQQYSEIYKMLLIE